MKYIIYDLEFNQKDPNSIQKEDNSSLTLPFEIIQIGALKLDEKFRTVSKFNTLIKPTVHNNIHPYVEKLTKITNEKLSSCKTFSQIYGDFLKFIGNDETVLCVWGVVDIKELLRNIRFHNLSTSLISKYYIDIQQYASKYFEAPKGSRIGLKNTVELLNISANNEFHDAFNDAYYTAEIFKNIHNKNMKPNLYNPVPSRALAKPKEKIDNVALIKQFEKIYNRKMTKEEVGMIKLAYMMGKTKQFIV